MFSTAVLAGCGGSADRSPLSSGAAATSGTAASSGTATSGSGSTAEAATDNGVAELSAEEIIERARAAATEAESVHIEGDIENGQQSIGLNLRIKGSEGAVGTMTLGRAGAGAPASLQLLRIGQEVYVMGDDAFYAQVGAGEAAKLLKGKYLKSTSSGSDFADLASFTDLDKLFGDLLEPEGKLSKGQSKTIEGVEAIGVVDETEEGSGTLYVAAEGEPYPLLVEGPAEGDATGSVTFSDYNDPVDLTPPAADQIVDLEALRQQ